MDYCQKLIFQCRLKFRQCFFYLLELDTKQTGIFTVGGVEICSPASQSHPGYDRWVTCNWTAPCCQCRGARLPASTSLCCISPAWTKTQQSFLFLWESFTYKTEIQFLSGILFFFSVLYWWLFLKMKDNLWNIIDFMENSEKWQTLRFFVGVCTLLWLIQCMH